ncbi:MAG: WapI family immunity protein [Gibbsiella quercinecans]|uniref:WapI family immunity protein n=1 Tax=Gibbsiella quercinecans TaxID=929813 RepID=UPI003F3E0152
MFEINAGADALFRFTFVERLKEPEDRELDLINCWLEVNVPCIQLQCLCEFTPYELNVFFEQLSRFYSSLSSGSVPATIKFSPRIGILDITIRQISDSGVIGFTFWIRPDIQAGSELTGGLCFDQSYFPGLLAGLRSIIEADQV